MPSLLHFSIPSEGVALFRHFPTPSEGVTLSRHFPTPSEGVILRYIGESFVVTAVSFVLGFVLAEAAAPMFSALIGKNYSPLSSLTWGTAALWTGVIVLLSVIAGIIPAR